MRYSFWVDRGGTFTDCILHDRYTGRLEVTKVLSSDRAPILGIRKLLGLGSSDPIPPSEIRMGTTVATNALLERRGAASALLITRGFRDLMEIGDQTRPRLFDLNITKPDRLYRKVIEVEARALPDGSVLRRDRPEVLRDQLLALHKEDITSLAIVVLHAYSSAELELDIGDIARSVGFEHVALSHEVAPQLGLLGRGATTILDAYLTPLVSGYLKLLQDELPGCRLRLMQSSGGLTHPEAFRAQHSLLSGPAGGVVACAEVVQKAGFALAIGFDMGGTSTDVSRYAGDYERVYEREIAGVNVMAPMLDIHTVAAGGGSICTFDGKRFQVGPESAGADPGPLCYGNKAARQLTITDLNLVLGRLEPDLFPFSLHREPVLQALERMREKLAEAGQQQSTEQIAQGLLRIANANMAEAISQVSVARGYDVRSHALVVFGGAGGQHACQVANLLGIETILFHPLAGVLSAYGMGLAPLVQHRQADAGHAQLSAQLLADLAPVFLELEARAQQGLESDGAAGDQLSLRKSLDLGYRGTETVLNLELGTADTLHAQFELAHERLFGYQRPAHPIVVSQVRVELSSRPPILGEPVPEARPVEGPPPLWATRTLWGTDEQGPRAAAVYERARLASGHRIAGPAVVLDQIGSIVVDVGFTLSVQPDGVLMVTRTGHAEAPPVDLVPDRGQPDPVQLELMSNRFMSIARQMGHVLRRTASSTNIRERLDFSCAVFNRDAALVANAPHIPVHLGAMGEAVAAINALHPNPAPGDVFVSNDPGMGGSHLPDITVVSPVHSTDGELIFYVASRGHHADVGGKSPGSMPADSTCLGDEGVVFRGEKIVSEGVFLRPVVLQVLESGPHPARLPDSNVADLEAQIAANRRGVELLSKLVAELGSAFVEKYMGHILDYAEERVALLISGLPNGTLRCSDQLDDGTLLNVELTVSSGRLVIDFTGTSPEHPGNLNAPRAVTLSAVLYVLRTLVHEDIPLNSGCLRPVTVIIPKPSLLSPGPNAAVAAGNVETSQRVVDILLGALGKMAASQGTMNNLTFGNDQLGYYETLAGGAGAGHGFAGASAVHTHMTNTRITDPEVLEARYPVRVVEFSVRRGSGGDGRWRGGDGLIRELEFLSPLTVSIVSDRRTTLPFGICGGHAAEPGQNLLNGKSLPGRAEFQVSRGDHLRIETPGGGGYGPPRDSGLEDECE